MKTLPTTFLYWTVRSASSRRSRKGGQWLGERLRQRWIVKSVGIAASAALSVTASLVSVQAAYPDKSIRILVGFPAGTAPDIAARLVGERLQAAWGKPVVIENLPGAGGNLAADRVAKAAPDGHTLLMAGNASITINLNVYNKLPFDPVKDLAPISIITMTPNVLAVANDVPAKTVQDLVAAAKARPDELTYGHGGVGISQHLAGELFKHMAGLSIRPVSYKSVNMIMPDLMAGRVSMCFCNISSVLPQAREGKTRMLAVTSLQRAPQIPDLPSMVEAGFPGFEATAWFGLMAPAGTSNGVIEALHRESVRAIATPGVRSSLNDLGMVVVGNSPDEFKSVIMKDIAYWEKLIKVIGLEKR